MKKGKTRIWCSECGQETKPYIITTFVKPYAKDAEATDGVVIPFGLKGETFINADSARAVSVCFETKEECVEWMKRCFPLYQFVEWL